MTALIGVDLLILRSVMLSRRTSQQVAYDLESMIAGLDALMEELSFGRISAEREGSREVLTCRLGPTTP